MLTADSMQVYRLMDIGTAKPPLAERRGVPHHLIDLVDPDEPFSVAQYQSLAMQKISEVLARGRLPILAGGTGLYVRSVLDRYDFIPIEPDHCLRQELLEREHAMPGSLYDLLSEVDKRSAAKIHANDTRRQIRALEVYLKTGRPISERWRHAPLPYDVRYFGLTGPRDWLYQRIEERVDKQIADGLIDEVRYLRSLGYSKNLTSMQGLGYKEVFPYLEGQATMSETRSLIVKNTRHFAKRQYTWFRADKRIEWIDVGKPNGVAFAVERITRDLEGTRSQLDE